MDDIKLDFYTSKGTKEKDSLWKGHLFIAALSAMAMREKPLSEHLQMIS